MVQYTPDGTWNVSRSVRPTCRTSAYLHLRDLSSTLPGLTPVPTLTPLLAQLGIPLTISLYPSLVIIVPVVIIRRQVEVRLGRGGEGGVAGGVGEGGRGG